VNTQTTTPRLPLKPAAGDQAKPSSPAEAAEKEAAEKEAAEKEAAEKEAAEKEAAEKEAAEKEAAEKEAKKPPRKHRGPPRDGAPEKRVLMVLTTSKLSDTNGVRLRRGRLVSVPERRVEGLVNQGRIRKASAEEVEVLQRRHGRAELG
jgi:hypothetical protein